MRWKRAATALALLPACSAPTVTGAPAVKGFEKVATVSATLTPAQIEVVRAGLRRALKDPDSAKFGGMAAARSAADPEVFFVCGYVNARNSYGGYGGMMPFIGGLAPHSQSKAPTFVLSDLASSAGAATLAAEICRERYGIDLAAVPAFEPASAPATAKRAKG